VLGCICALAPDVDVVVEKVFDGWGPLWSHHGLTHSIPAAGVIGLLAALAWCWRRPQLRGRRAIYTLGMFGVFTCLGLSHILLDLLTGGGSGLMLLAPFDQTRYMLGWQPIRALVPLFPLGPRQFPILACLVSEIIVVWIPLTVVLLVKQALAYRNCQIRSPSRNTCVSPIPEVRTRRI
jgi:membrane-bound metal-dependent hydrolase YbcI (DUF457 family)